MSEFCYPPRVPPKSPEEKTFLDAKDTDLAKQARDYMEKYPTHKWEPLRFEGNRSYWRERNYNCICAKRFVCHSCKDQLNFFSYIRGIDCPDLHYLCVDCSKLIHVWRIQEVILE